jgi:hypothetical protein
LEMVYNDKTAYPVSNTAVILGTASTSVEMITGYMNKLPLDPLMSDCPTKSPAYTGYAYQSTDGTTYTISYCLGGASGGGASGGGLDEGVHTATPAGIQ